MDEALADFGREVLGRISVLRRFGITCSCGTWCPAWKLDTMRTTSCAGHERLLENIRPSQLMRVVFTFGNMTMQQGRFGTAGLRCIASCSRGSLSRIGVGPLIGWRGGNWHIRMFARYALNCRKPLIICLLPVFSRVPSGIRCWQRGVSRLGHHKERIVSCRGQLRCK